jgi:hypothetical protein
VTTNTPLTDGAKFTVSCDGWALVDGRPEEIEVVTANFARTLELGQSEQARDAARWRLYCEWLEFDRQGKPTLLDELSDFTAVDELTRALDNELALISAEKSVP